MFNSKITCAYLYIITKYGYPPKAEMTLQYLEEMKQLGFASVELEGIREEHLMGVYNIKEEIVAKMKELQLEVPYFCVVLPGLTSLDDKERDHQLGLFDKGCQVAVDLGSKGVLDNAPLPPYKFPNDIPIVRHYHEDVLNAAYLPKDQSWNKIWDQIIDTYRTACDIAKSYNLTYQMHPAVGVLSSTTDAFLYFHDAVKRDNLRFNIDTANQFVMKDSLALALRRLKDHVDYIHISDNGGFKVEHLNLGEGDIRWDVFFETLDFIGFDGHLGIDVGGDESLVKDLDKAYIESAKFISQIWKNLGDKR
jgi:sugar phosphate isomerase/epimerase